MWSVLEKLQSNNINQVFVPAGCTGELQQLVVGIDKHRFKNLMQNSFTRWYAVKERDKGFAHIVDKVAIESFIKIS